MLVSWSSLDCVGCHAARDQTIPYCSWQMRNRCRHNDVSLASLFLAPAVVDDRRRKLHEIRYPHSTPARFTAGGSLAAVVSLSRGAFSVCNPGGEISRSHCVKPTLAPSKRWPIHGRAACCRYFNLAHRRPRWESADDLGCASCLPAIIMFQRPTSFCAPGRA